MGLYHAKEPVAFMGKEHDLQKAKEDRESYRMRCEDRRLLAAGDTQRGTEDAEEPGRALRCLKIYTRQLEDLCDGLALGAEVCDRDCLLLSVEDFEEYLGALRRLEEENRKELFVCNQMLYTRLLREVPTWARMLSTIQSAVASYVWLEDEPQHRQEVLGMIRQRQHEVAEQWTAQLGFMLRPQRLPADVLQLLAQFSLPVGEVRVALCDDEDQMACIRRGEFRYICPLM